MGLDRKKKTQVLKMTPKQTERKPVQGEEENPDGEMGELMSERERERRKGGWDFERRRDKK